MDVRAECAEERDRLSMTLEEQDGSSMDTKGTEQSGIFIEFFFSKGVLLRILFCCMYTCRQ